MIAGTHEKKSERTDKMNYDRKGKKSLENMKGGHIEEEGEMEGET